MVAVGKRHGTRRKELHVDESQLLGHLEIHAVLGVVQVGVGGIDTQVILDSQARATLHLRQVSHLLQAVEEQRMMAHHEIAAQFDRLAEHVFRHV